MGLDSWGSTIGYTASLCMILQMLAPIPSCYSFYVKRSVGDMVATPYIVAMTSCSLWALYGFIIHDNAVIKVNIIGCFLQLCYTIIYYRYSIRKTQVKKQTTLALGAISATVFYSLLEKDHDRLVSILGIVTCCVTVAFFISPLANIGFVIRVWNSESLPKLLILATFIVSVQWTIYGFIKNDIYIQVTNLLGSIVSGFQLLLIAIIPSVPNEKVLDI